MNTQTAIRKVDIQSIKTLKIVPNAPFLETPLTADSEKEIAVLEGVFLKQTIKGGQVTFHARTKTGPVSTFWMEIHGSQRCFICVCNDDTGECGCVEVPCARKPTK